MQVCACKRGASDFFYEGLDFFTQLSYKGAVGRRYVKEDIFFVGGSFVNLGGKFLIFDIQRNEGVKNFFLKGAL